MRGAFECGAVTAVCACGAIGRILPPDFGYQYDVRVPLVEWHGGNIGDGWVAVEPLPASRSSCPGCHRRADAHFMHIRTEVPPRNDDCASGQSRAARSR